MAVIRVRASVRERRHNSPLVETRRKLQYVLFRCSCCLSLSLSPGTPTLTNTVIIIFTHRRYFHYDSACQHSLYYSYHHQHRLQFLISITISTSPTTPLPSPSLSPITPSPGFSHRYSVSLSRSASLFLLLLRTTTSSVLTRDTLYSSLGGAQLSLCVIHISFPFHLLLQPSFIQHCYLPIPPASPSTLLYEYHHYHHHYHCFHHRQRHSESYSP